MMYKQALLEVPDKIAFRNELLAQFPEFFDLDESGDPYAVPNHRFNYQPTAGKGVWHIIVSDADWDLLKTGTWTTCTVMATADKYENIWEELAARPAMLALYIARVFWSTEIEVEWSHAYEFIIRNIETGIVRKYWEEADVIEIGEEKADNPNYQSLRIAGEWA